MPALRARVLEELHALRILGAAIARGLAVAGASIGIRIEALIHADLDGLFLRRSLPGDSQTTILGRLAVRLGAARGPTHIAHTQGSAAAIRIKKTRVTDRPTGA